MIIFVLQAISRGSPHLIRIPYCAHFPVPTIIAVGVANHKAQGQAMTITAAKYMSADWKLAPNQKYRIRNVVSAMRMTTGTNIGEILSAMDWIGALDPCASWIRVMICASFVPVPTCEVCISKLQSLLIVPANTFSPMSLSTGILSPVSMDSSTLEFHVIMIPSTGILSPGLTTTIS